MLKILDGWAKKNIDTTSQHSNAVSTVQTKKNVAMAGKKIIWFFFLSNVLFSSFFWDETLSVSHPCLTTILYNYATLVWKIFLLEFFLMVKVWIKVSRDNESVKIETVCCQGKNRKLCTKSAQLAHMRENQDNSIDALSCATPVIQSISSHLKL